MDHPGRCDVRAPERRPLLGRGSRSHAVTVEFVGTIRSFARMIEEIEFVRNDLTDREPTYNPIDCRSAAE